MKPPLGECRSCGAGVYWALSASGKPMPINPRPTGAGNIVLHQDDDRWTAVVRSSADPLARYVSHFATCPDAGRWRRR
jgi:hypothetical protein